MGPRPLPRRLPRPAVCGIAGYAAGFGRAEIDLLRRSLAHRGPDGDGSFVDPAAGVALVATRLAIQDLEHGAQPMGSEDGGVQVVFNGEIYNARALRERLAGSGHRFASANSDTEVLVHLYEELGEAMVDELNGMFAFVIYDARRRRLFGARDRMGIKPLYLARPGGGLAFASELKTLLELPGIERRLDPAALFHYLSLRFVPGPGSIVEAVERLPAAHLFVYELDRSELTMRPYWRPRFGASPPPGEHELVPLLREQLLRAVRRWTVSDVPIACSLSGGIDSSAVVALMSEVGYPDLRTYSLGFEEEEWSELPLARLVAERYGTDHHELVLRPGDLLDDLLAMVWALDEPYGGGLPSWYVFRLMSGRVKVGMTGTGGDELFGGYGRFRWFEEGSLPRAAASRWIARRPVRAAAAAAARIPGRWTSDIGRAALRDLRSLRDEPARWHYFERSYYFSDQAKRDLVLEGADRLPATGSLLQTIYDESGAGSTRDAVAYLDFRTQLPEEFLLMTDRFSMAHSLEARVPFLDHELVEFVASIPASLRTRPDDLKALLKSAVADLLPEPLLGATKRGFVIPTGEWLRGELRPLTLRLLDPERLRRQGLFRPAIFEHFVLPHLERRADFGDQVWTLLMFQLWHVLYVEERLAAAPTFTWRDIAD